MSTMRDVNRFQIGFMGGLIGVLLLDVAIAGLFSILQGTNFLGVVRITIGFTGVLLLILGGVISGAVRSRPQAAGTAKLLVPPSVKSSLAAEWSREGLDSSLVSRVGIVYGGILGGIAVLLYLVPAA